MALTLRGFVDLPAHAPGRLRPWGCAPREWTSLRCAYRQRNGRDHRRGPAAPSRHRSGVPRSQRRPLRGRGRPRVRGRPRRWQGGSHRCALGNRHQGAHGGAAAQRAGVEFNPQAVAGRRCGGPNGADHRSNDREPPPSRWVARSSAVGRLRCRPGPFPAQYSRARLRATSHGARRREDGELARVRDWPPWTRFRCGWR